MFCCSRAKFWKWGNSCFCFGNYKNNCFLTGDKTNFSVAEDSSWTVWELNMCIIILWRRQCWRPRVCMKYREYTYVHKENHSVSCKCRQLEFPSFPLCSNTAVLKASLNKPVNDTLNSHDHSALIPISWSRWCGQIPCWENILDIMGESQWDIWHCSCTTAAQDSEAYLKSWHWFNVCLCTWGLLCCFIWSITLCNDTQCSEWSAVLYIWGLQKCTCKETADVWFIRLCILK